MAQTVIYPIKNRLRKDSHRTGAAAYAKAVRRYNFKTDLFEGIKGRVLSFQKDASGHEVPAESIAHDLEYVVPVTVGNPGVELMLDFDTGSSDLWVWSSDLKANEPAASEHAVYDPKNSSSAKQITGATWSISYGDGSSASGVVYEDDVKIGDLKCSEQGVEVAQKLSSSFLNSQGSDGLLGLAWPQINTAKPQQKTPMQNLMEKNIMDQGLFTVCLKHDTDGKGFYSFGTILAEAAGVKESDIIYAPVDNKQGFWAYSSAKAKVGEDTFDLPNNIAIADTGTTLALVSEAVITALYQKIPGAVLDRSAGGWVYPVDAKVPDVQLAVAGNMYTIPGKKLGYGEPDKGMIFGGVQSRGNLSFDILGDTFLKNVYVVFDQKNVRIGFAQRSSN